MKRVLQISGIVAIVVLGTIVGIISANFSTEEPHAEVALRELSLDDQIGTSDAAIIGTVLQVLEPYPDKNAEYVPRYFTDVVVRVDQILFGNVDQNEITIRTEANTRQATQFSEGETSILFLIGGKPGSVEGEGVYVVHGMYQGKFSIGADNLVQDPLNMQVQYDKTELIQQIRTQRNVGQ